MKTRKYDPIAALEARTAEQNRRAEKAKALAVKGMTPQKVDWGFFVGFATNFMVGMAIAIALFWAIGTFGPGAWAAVLVLLGG